MAETVTIGKTYFEALLRRAEFHTDQDERKDKIVDEVIISKVEHARLTRAEREYSILRTALFRGGLTAETLDVLISGAPSSDDDFVKVEPWESTFTVPKTVPVTITNPDSSTTPQASNNLNSTTSYLNARTGIDRKSSFGASVESPGQDEHFMPESTDAYAARAPFPRNDQRTILISNLSDRATHQDLVGILRGGRLLDVYLRNDRSATVSFVEGAADFVAYAKRNDFYMHGKRLEIRWNDRQFHLPYHVANKIASGATRNLVIRNNTRQTSNPSSQTPITEQSLREDLEHIHNLVVVSATSKNGDWYVSTNSIHNALFARTCMMSRAKYKGNKIEWYPDECAGPLPQPRQKSSPPWKTAQVAQTKKPAPSLANRFDVLDIDGTDDTSSGAEDDGLPLGLRGGGIGLNWADSTIAA
ncbi:hypothetical protein NA57DRAFT_77877 [Rhizodiscina lignyota]|uniref:RRM domain-containing protein n=1 Tax=Rhizodiscina lignyota TaxID=1504668 RepID=A0A9P4IEJ5_9PEZI|nr:hypothetical protein NA57DRAFT_77877 [Rhizodiscina lignyota]